jgi:hypothetical protein
MAEDADRNAFKQNSLMEAKLGHSLDVTKAGLTAELSALLLKLLTNGVASADTLYMVDKAVFLAGELGLLHTACVSVGGELNRACRLPVLGMSMEFLDGPNAGKIGIQLNVDLCASARH